MNRIQDSRHGQMLGQKPFRSERERRKWQLEQKRRWLVESRLGRGRGGPLDNGGGHPSMTHNPRYYGSGSQNQQYNRGGQQSQQQQHRRVPRRPQTSIGMSKNSLQQQKRLAGVRAATELLPKGVFTGDGGNDHGSGVQRPRSSVDFYSHEDKPELSVMGVTHSSNNYNNDGNPHRPKTGGRARFIPHM